MKRQFYPVIVLCIGLMSAQIVACAHVYLSNLNLLQSIEAVVRSGYLAVPNALVAGRLDTLATAMAGGVFFTLSIGSGLSLITLCTVWLWDRVFKRRRREALLFLGVWLTALYLINASGLNLIASLYLVVVPLVTGVAAIMLLPVKTTLLSPVTVLWPVSAALLLTLIWGMVLDARLFTNIRDYLLLPTRVGERVAKAYYDYTLYPAEAFKSLSQKQIRTCVIKEGMDRSQYLKLEKSMRRCDYLPVPDGYPADLTIALDRETACFSIANGESRAFDVTAEELFGKPQQVLERFSAHQDRNRMFRRLSLVCLLIGFPLVLYSFIFALVSALPILLFPARQAIAITSVICICIGLILLAPVYRGYSAVRSPEDLIAGLSSFSYATRIAALRTAYKQNQDISKQAAFLKLESSPFIAERYWLARCLAYSKGAQTRVLLRRLAGDPVPIVACQALWAISKRKDRKMIPQIIDHINTTPIWYIQMYAYRALRTLEWVQPRSPLASY